MNCKQFREYCEMNPRTVDIPGPDSVEVAEHIAECSACNCLIEERKELSKCLRAVRDSAPAISATLDGAVLAKYRGHQFEKSRSRISVPLIARLNVREALGLAAAVAFAGLVAYGAMLLFLPGQRGWVDRETPARHQRAVPRTAAMGNKVTAAGPVTLRKQARAVVASARHRNLSVTAAHDNSGPTQFQNLMYCDSISCPGAMDVIRVQLPSPILGMTSAPAQTNGFISADVLVGPDGIARGIRIVE